MSDQGIYYPESAAIGSETKPDNLQVDVEVQEQNVQHAADQLVAAKTRLNSDMKIICAEIDSMYKISSEFNKDTRRLERGIEAMPILEDWVQEKVSAIEQLKSQIVFLHKVMDED